jgi:hypothetical protein
VLVSDFQINGFLDYGFLELTSILGVSWSGDSFDFWSVANLGRYGSEVTFSILE